ncbi:putative ABC transporter permease protein [Mycolicibacterium fortuitum subsp. acetamidolyticum]|uniref:Putative ABC transporter permease protein n=1 Tax=Mycolicibacterium fortuitum subsp. acetamidolyticum TaxID=144550 RepID=A0A117IEM9_MYCFO|nr:hypothetical protein [Mycolicibacterium fortuitum]MCV7140372.1 hypothetical protein [Mycolicibacterium fortuitum]GAT02948.1 putative ABC transporter permease protein [Mycolicibacterium fortuitum subsp. acetamidolyticum]
MTTEAPTMAEADVTTETEETEATLGKPRAPEWMEPCSADGCVHPPERAGLCAQHRRTLTLTAKVCDAVGEFLKSAEIPVNNTLIENQVMEAGECLAQGLGLLASTQFDEQLFWNPSPIHLAGIRGNKRWRVEFVWRIAETDDIGEVDETKIDQISGNQK